MFLNVHCNRDIIKRGSFPAGVFQTLLIGAAKVAEFNGR